MRERSAFSLAENTMTWSAKLRWGEARLKPGTFEKRVSVGCNLDGRSGVEHLRMLIGCDSLP